MIPRKQCACFRHGIIYHGREDLRVLRDHIILIIQASDFVFLLSVEAELSRKKAYIGPYRPVPVETKIATKPELHFIEDGYASK